MRTGLKAIATSLALVFAATACGSEAPPAGPAINPDPTLPDDEEPVNKETPLLLQQALAEFGECMDLEIWMRTGMWQMPVVETEDNEECQACHQEKDGAGAVRLDGTDQVGTFDDHAQMPTVMRLVTGTVDERGNFLDLVPSNRYIEKGLDSCIEDVTACHPDYELPPDMLTAVQEFVSITLERWKNKTCDTPYTFEE